MTLVMLRYDEKNSEAAPIFMAFAIASCRAQEMESLLKLNLQYSMVLAGKFATLSHSDESSRSHGKFAMGSILEELKVYVHDEQLLSSIQSALRTRNELVHHFFAKRQAGLSPTAKEIEDAVKWCQDATVAFRNVCLRLETRWVELQAQLVADPDGALPGLKERVAAIEIDEWEWP